MAKIETYTLELRSARSREAALLLAALDDQLGLLLADLKGITPAELAWQPRRGANTIGMLLAHLALVEVYWLAVAEGRFEPEKLAAGPEVRARVDAAVERVLGMGFDGDGMPLAPGGTPPRHLKGWTLARYRALLRRARRHISPRVRAFRERDLDRMVGRVRLNGRRSRASIRWILYHVLEHFSGHYGQILLIRHLHRDRGRRA